MSLLDEIKNKLVEMDYDGTINSVKRAVESGLSLVDVINALSAGMEEVGRKYEEGEYFLAELVMAGEIMKDSFNLIKPKLKTDEVAKRGVVVVGTVRGDLHDIGKNIFATFLVGAGFEVIDLGVDVPPEKFIEEVKRRNADILAMSALLTTTMQEMKVVIDELRKAGLRERVKVIVGGAPVTEEYAKEIGADAYAEDAIKGVEICKKWVS